MTKEYIKEIPNWEKEYLEMRSPRLLSAQQVELLEGRYIKANEGMIYGAMYVDWKRRRWDEN
tara:strand:+ start:262 stop:447 length:186 start_codon:yes stop_codon:yes gene_type:complete